MQLKGTRTEANLMAAFSGESMARNKYDFYAKEARKEGLIEIAEIFEETARNEQAHAKLWFRTLDKLGSTKENLEDACACSFLAVSSKNSAISIRPSLRASVA